MEKKEKKPMWLFYSVVLNFNKEDASSRIMGGIPKEDAVVEAWLDKSKMTDKQYEKRIEKGEKLRPLAEIKEEVLQNTQAMEDKVHVGFLYDNEGIYAREHQIKAHLKDCANQLKGVLEVKALKSKLANRVYVMKEKNYFTKNGGVCVKKADGCWEHGIRVMGPLGERSALKRNDYIENAILNFTIRVLNDRVITSDILTAILEYGGEHGIFSERGMGYGKYTFELSEHGRNE